MPTATAARAEDRASRTREGLRCRVRLANGRVFAGPLAPERHRALQLGLLHEHTDGLVELAAGARRDGRLQISTRRRTDHFLPGGQSGREGWLRALLELAAAHADRGEEVFVAPAARSAARGEKQAVSETRFLWVDVDQPGQLHALWAFLAERPCHLLVESGGSGGAHAYFKLAEPLPATRVIEGTGELIEPIERGHLRIIHHLGVGADGKPNVADPACAERSRVMRLAGSINAKTGAHARIVEADFRLPGYPLAQLVGDLPDPMRRQLRALGARARAPIRTSGSARRSTSRSSPGSRCRATGSCPAQPSGITIGTRRARSAPTPARDGAVTAAAAGRAGRSTTSPRCCLAAPGGAKLRGEAFKRARAYVADVFGELT